MTKFRLLLGIGVIFGLLILAIFTSLPDKDQRSMETEGSMIPERVHTSYITEYLLPTPESGPMAITVDHKGEVWVAATNITKLVHFNPISKTFREFKIPKVNWTSIWGMTVDSSGMIWFTSTNDNSVWSFNPKDNTFKQYNVPTPDSFPMQIAIDQQGSIWFTELYAGKLGQIIPDTGVIAEYKVPRNKSGPAGLSIDIKGDIWFADAFANTITKFSPRNSTFVDYAATESIFSPTGIVTDSSAVWFLEHGGSLFGRLNQSDNSITKYATSITGTFPTTLPYWLAIDKVGNIWFNEHSGNRIARFDPKSETLVEYELPKGRIGTGAIVNALEFAIAPDGNVWFAEWTENKIGMINASASPPFKLEVNQRRISTTPGSDIKIEVTLSGTFNKQVTLQTSGTFSFTGKLLNATTQFNPQQLPISKSNSYKSDLTVRLGDSLVPRRYVMTIGASDGAVIYSVMIHLDVREIR
ncbi:MAG: hypothetical protein HYY67_07970 [Thaumarchaeota archaeon]|nr:hypothetical protein [Nitrososphaerota archaeon]